MMMCPWQEICLQSLSSHLHSYWSNHDIYKVNDHSAIDASPNPPAFLTLENREYPELCKKRPWVWTTVLYFEPWLFDYSIMLFCKSAVSGRTAYTMYRRSNSLCLASRNDKTNYKCLNDMPLSIQMLSKIYIFMCLNLASSAQSVCRVEVQMYYFKLYR